MQRIKRGRALIALMLLMILAVTGTSTPVDVTAAQHTVTHYGLAGDGNNVAGIYRIGGMEVPKSGADFLMMMRLYWPHL